MNVIIYLDYVPHFFLGEGFIIFFDNKNPNAGF